MLGHDLRTRSLISSWFTFFLFLLLLIYFVFIEFFKDSQLEEQKVNPVQSPIRLDIISGVNAIKFKNRIGKYTLIKDSNGWIMQEPRIMPANSKTIDTIIKALRDIQVQTIHQKEPINFRSFSLDNPTLEIDLFTMLDEKLNIKVGLINPINRTSYVIVSGQDYIYQTNLIDSKLQSFELLHFIDSSIFSMPVDRIKTLKIYHGRSNHPYNNLEQNDGAWKMQRYNVINDSNVSKTVQSLLDIKTHMIIDKKDERLQNFINNYLKNPLYRITIGLNDEQKITYTVSHLIKAISDLKIEKRQYFLMTASNRPYPYVISKKYLNNFIIKYQDIKN